MRLGELIEQLRSFDRDLSVYIGGKLPCTLVPKGVDSYRGYYCDLAIGVHAGGRGADRTTVGELLAELEGAIGKTFVGYKGGEYVMGKQTRVWLSNYGECSDADVTGAVRVETGWVHLTWESEDE